MDCPSSNHFINPNLNNNNNNIPTKFYLYQNYPNPFNPDTKIKYDVPIIGKRNSFHVQVRIYDILGREISTLVNDYKQSGSYEIEWNASNYASGIYFYKIEAGDFITTKKMLLIK